jgi:sec-independent protein translocase protein TatB
VTAAGSLPFPRSTVPFLVLPEAHVPGTQELLVIALVALFVLGPERLPEVARAASRLLTKVRNYGVTASKELRGVADLGGIQQEVDELRRELDRTRSDLRRAMRETVAASDTSPTRSRTQVPPIGDGMVELDADGAMADADTAVETDVEDGADRAEGEQR